MVIWEGWVTGDSCHCCSHSNSPVSTRLHSSFREKPRSFQRYARMSQAMHHYVHPKPSVFPTALLASLCWYVSHRTGRLPLQHCGNGVSVICTVPSSSHMANLSSFFKSQLWCPILSIYTELGKGSMPEGQSVTQTALFSAVISLRTTWLRM